MTKPRRTEPALPALGVQAAGLGLESNRRENGAMPGAPEEVVREMSKLFKLLSDETRLNILAYLLRRREMHVRALCDVLGQSQPAVSHHLALLRVAGLIEARREGKHNFYHLRPGRFQELLDLAFAGQKPTERKFRIVDYVLQYSPDGQGNGWATQAESAD